MIRQSLVAALFFLLLLAQAFTLQHCATPTPPRGGDRDSLGPVLIPEESTPNFQTDFRPEEIRLTFDEWVELDPAQEIIISPPLELGIDNRPQLQRRSLVIPLDGIELRDSVTYVINIGAAIKDFNEGNPTENLRFVFATGPELDTASVSASVVDAYTGEPIDGAALTLYDNLADTAVFTENPTYFAQTDEEGRVTVSNVRPGVYRVVALTRTQGATNYFADFGGFYPPTAAGFLDSTITVTDGNTDIGAVRLSPVVPEPRIVEFEADRYGMLKVAVNQGAENVDLLSQREYLRSNFGDTIRLFYREPAADTILFGRDGTYSDTLFFSGTDAGTEPALPLSAIDKSSGRINPTEGARLLFNRPIEAVDTSLIRLYRDTLRLATNYRVTIDSLYPAQVRVDAGWQPEVPYELELLPGAVTDWYGRTNPDSIVRVLNAASVESLGNLTIYLENLNGAVSYILRLVDEQGEVITGTQRFISNDFEYVASYLGLRPATYRMELIYDSNNNGRFDSGNLRFGYQPEVVRRFEIEPLRANWEVEKIVDLENN